MNQCQNIQNADKSAALGAAPSGSAAATGGQSGPPAGLPYTPGPWSCSLPVDSPLFVSREVTAGRFVLSQVWASVSKSPSYFHPPKDQAAANAVLMAAAPELYEALKALHSRVSCEESFWPEEIAAFCLLARLDAELSLNVPASTPTEVGDGAGRSAPVDASGFFDDDIPY